LENEATENFLAHVRAEFLVFEELIYEEVIEPRWEGSREEKASLKSRESQERAQIMFRGLAHSLRQPLTGVEWDIEALKSLVSRDDIPKDAKKLLLEIQASLSVLTARAQALIREFLEAEPPEFSEVSAADLVKSAVQQVEALADMAGIEVKSENLKDETVLVAAGLVKQSLAAILSNSIEAPRPSGVSPVVTISDRTVNGNVILTVADNGTGISDAMEGTPLSEIESTKGRPAAGLFHAEEAIAASKGRVQIAETGASGTRVEIFLPTKIAGLSRPEV
jgi:signal transduction histidine kinase